jgi:fucose permease
MKNYANVEEAAYCASIFWLFVVIGRLGAVLLANVYSINKKLLFLLYLGSITMLLCLIFQSLGYGKLVIFGGSALFGIAISAIYPFLMSLPNYMKMKTAAKNTSKYIFSGAVG